MSMLDGCADGYDAAICRFVRESERLLFAVLDRDGCIQDSNRAVARLVGTSTIPVGRPLADFLAPEERSRFLAWLQDPHGPVRLEFSDSQNNLTEYECSLEKGPAGSLFFAEPSAVTASDMIDQIARVNNELVDATRNLHKKNRALEEARNRLARITESAQDAILMMDPKGDIALWNPAAEKILGYTLEEALGKNLHNLIAPDRYLPAHSAAFPDFVRTGRGGAVGKTIELAAIRKDGQEIPIELSLSALSLGGRWHALGILRDISERKQYESELRKKEATEAAYRAKIGFLATMSHELRTPMNAIIGFAHLIRSGPLTARQTEQLDRISASAQKLMGIINDVIDISRAESSQLTMDIRNFDLSRIIDQVSGAVSGQMTAKNLDLTVDLGDAPAMLRGDGGRLKQILSHLVGNAVKFTEAGRIDIIARAADKAGRRVRLRLEIRDTGMGMTPEASSRLFQIFEQADGSRTRKFGGAGLGLALCRRLVELMHGEIGIVSDPGRGTTVWMEIPFEIPSETPEDVHRLDVGALRGVRVLVVDDLKDVREILAAMLTELGMRPDTEASGEAGLDAVKRADDDGDPYQALIVHWKMPGLNGIETALRINSLPLNHRPKFLMATAYGEDLPDEEALAAGVSRVLIKPLTPKDLSRALSETLDLGAPLGPSAERLTQQKTMQTSREEYPSAESLAPEQITEVLDRLDALLADYSTSANDLFDGSKALLTAALGPVAKKIRQQIQNFDYEEALNTLREARKGESSKKLKAQN